MKKFLKKTIIFVLAVVTLAFTGCGRVPSDNSDPISDGKTVNVKISKAGYGTTYIYKLADRFNELYKEEGYKINVLYPQTISDSVVVQDIYDDKGIDLYFVGGSVEKGVAGDYGHCYADITDLVFNQKPIRFDGRGYHRRREDRKPLLRHDVRRKVLRLAVRFQRGGYVRKRKGSEAIRKKRSENDQRTFRLRGNDYEKRCRHGYFPRDLFFEQ